MTWAELCADPSLNDLPYKIETDRFGRVMMYRTNVAHSEHLTEISCFLGDQLPSWIVITRCPVDTKEGTKVADVAAFPLARCPNFRDLVSLPIAPDICVEVHTIPFDPTLLEEKRRLYAALGSLEFWTCSSAGALSFVDASTGQSLRRSRLCHTFPENLPHPQTPV